MDNNNLFDIIEYNNDATSLDINYNIKLSKEDIEFCNNFINNNNIIISKKNEKRVLRNRASAERSRIKKMNLLKKLEEENEKLKKENNDLKEINFNLLNYIKLNV